MNIIKNIKHRYIRLFEGRKYSKSQKIFCIGRNKTGTTSMALLFKQLGIPVAPQKPAEMMIQDWKKKDFKNLIQFVKYRGIAFQDIPFSWPGTYKVLDNEFPNSKFILTVRDSSETWYKSLTSFHSKIFGDGKLPSKKELQESEYIYKGWSWEANRSLYNTPEDDIYQKPTLMRSYEKHNEDVINYFKDKPHQLLVINLKDPDASKMICSFLETDKIIERMPWVNKT